MLFKQDLKRFELLSVPLKSDNRLIKIAVHRNHSFEMAASVLNTFLDFSNLQAEFSYSDYDDSLNFSEVKKDVDINLIWLDVSRYKNISVKEWLAERISYLKSISNAKILLYHTGEVDLSSLNIADVLIVDMNNIKLQLGEQIFDLAKEEYSGTRLSNKASLHIAREIGLKYIPALLITPLKAIVLDLDNTLYEGVLGEDGINGIKPFIELQKHLKELKEQGFLLAIASKNEEIDVKMLFENRKDFPLSFENFSAYEINWESKAENINKIAKKLNIGIDSMLFIDDNIGEVEQVRTFYPQIKIVEAVSSEIVLDTLKYYPGLFKSNLSNEDKIRTEDIKANKQREFLSKTLSEDEYLKKLEIKLTYEINPICHLKRITELLNKTNQFIMSYARYNETQIEEFLQNPDYCVLTISMSDKLSDSGIIAILISHKDKGNLFIDELVVSCRALGRNIEDCMIKKALMFTNETLRLNGKSMLSYKKGERNKPALSWIEKNSPDVLGDSGVVSLTTDNVSLNNIDIALKVHGGLQNVI
jgi:FkbH-like protein